MPTLEMIQDAVHQAVTEYPVKRVELFGSYANGTADAESDVDFLVEFAENPTSLVQICGLRETLSELLHLKVDIVKLPRKPDDGMIIERTVPMYEAVTFGPFSRQTVSHYSKASSIFKYKESCLRNEKPVLQNAGRANFG